MKRLTALILILFMIPGLWACGQKEEFVSPVNFYYLRAPLPNGEIHHGSADSVIVPEIREGDGHQANHADLLDIYLLGPLDEDCRSPYPVGTTLEEFTLENGVASIVLSDDFGELTGIDLSLACGCLTLTIMDMTGAESVSIQAESAMLDGKAAITMDRNTLVLIDNTPAETN